MPRCEPYSTRLTKHFDEGSKILKLWNKSPNIRKFYGIAGQEGVGSSEGSQTLGMSMLKQLVMQRTGKPFDVYFPYKNRKMYDRIKIEVEGLERRLGGRKISAFERVTFVPRAIANRFPGIKTFLDNINRSVLYERNHNVFAVGQLKKAQRFMQAALLEADAVGRLPIGKKSSRNFIKKIDEIQDNIRVAAANGDVTKERQLTESLEKLIVKQGGNVIPKIIEYIEGDSSVRAKIKMEESDNVINAAKSIRDAFTDPEVGLGKVAILGLRKSIDVARNVYLGERKDGPEYVKFKRFEQRTREAIKGIEDNIKEARYFPHYLLLELPKFKHKIYELEESSSLAGRERILEEIATAYEQMREDGTPPTPEHLKGRRGEGLHEAWSKNPLGVLRRYSQDIIAFNKINHVKEAYMKSMHRVSRMDGELAESMRTFLDDMYKTATIGYTQRPGWVNKTARILTGTEFLSKIGFGWTTAVRNTLSFNYYLGHVGYKEFFRARGLYKTDVLLREKVDKALKEAGYEFNEANVLAAMEGVLPTEGIQKSSIHFDPKTEKVRYKKNGKWEVMDEAFAKVTGASAILQKITENLMRREMFRVSFIRMYETISQSPAMQEGHGNKLERIALTMAKNAGNEAVIADAFEYGVHAKAPVIGGTYKGYGFIGQLMGQFMHYSMSFMNRQAEHMRGSRDAIRAQQWDSSEHKTMARYAGIYAFTNLISGVLNLDFTRIMENDTVDRVRDMIGYLMAENEEERAEFFYGRGPASTILGGPLLSDLIFAGNVIGLYRMPDEEWAKMLVGYKDAYDMTDKEKHDRILNTVNVEIGRWLTKNIPAIANGSGNAVFEYEFGLYPRKWTSDWNKAIWGPRGFNQRTKKTREQQKRAKQIRTAREKYTKGKKESLMKALESF